MDSERVATYQFPYRILLVRVAASLLGAHFLVSFGEQYHLFELLLDPEYYTSLTGSFLIAFILLTIVHYINGKLDANYDWLENLYRRSLLQFFFGLVIPSIIAYLLAAVYFGIHGIFILDTVYLQYDFPVVVILLGIANLLYVMHYMYLRSKISDRLETVERSDFLVHKAGKNILLPIEVIAYFFHHEGDNYVRTLEGEQFLVTQSLDQVQSLLSGKKFFRANRQVIVNRQACEYFEPIENGKLQLIVQPGYADRIIISQKRAKGFREWMEG